MILASLVLAGLTCSPPASNTLIGRWESRDISRGGIGKVIDFRDDGSFVEAVSVIVTLHYELHGDTLTIIDPAASPGSEQPPPISIRFEGETHVLQARGGPPLRKSRVGATESAKLSIVGVWHYPHIKGLIAFERFTPDGDLFFRLPMKASRGCYVLEPEKNEMFMIFEGEDVKTLSFTAEGTQLKIQSAGDPVATYALSPWGAWYDIDSIDLQQAGRQP